MIPCHLTVVFIGQIKLLTDNAEFYQSMLDLPQSGILAI